MRHYRSLALLTCLLASVQIAPADPPEVSPQQAWEMGWPMIHGPYGNYQAPDADLDIVDKAADIRKLWVSEYNAIGIGKFGRRPEAAYRELVKIPKQQGGWASPIVAGGTVFVAHYQPHGEVLGPQRSKTLPAEAYSVLADDVVVAIDAKTGKTRWVSVQDGKGMNYIMGKRGGWGVTPVYHDGRVFAVGTTGRLYALDANSGELVWESTAPGHERLEQIKQKLLSEKKWAENLGTWGSSPIVADGVLIVPTYPGRQIGLQGRDPATGKVRWQIDEVGARTATPAIARLGQREYVLCGTAEGELTLIDPKTGEKLWRIDGLGPNPQTLQPVDGKVLVNIVPRERGVLARYAAYAFDTEGAKLAWEFPDRLRLKHEWWPDTGAHRRLAIGDGVVHFLTNTRKERGAPRHKVWARIDLDTGKLLALHEWQDQIRHPYLVEDKLIWFGDIDHHPISGRFHVASADLPQGARLPEWSRFDHLLTSGYEVSMEYPVAGGRMFMRTLDGRIVCYDLRKQSAQETSHP